jgi:hypothetical protein
MRSALLGLLALALSSCINWQAGYDEAARRECRSEIDNGERRACLDRTEENASRQRAERRD